jgi:dye decolorizing peroxidase
MSEPGVVTPTTDSDGLRDGALARHLARRAFMLAPAVVAAAASACSAAETSSPRSAGGQTGATDVAPAASSGAARTRLKAVDCWGPAQAGIVSPGRPQSYTVFTVFGGAAQMPAGDLRRVCAGLGHRIRQVTTGELAQIPEPGDLTVTVGVGLDQAVTLLGEKARVPALPVFAKDRISGQHTNGDLVVQVCASDLSVVTSAAAWLSQWLTTTGWRPRWTQMGARGEQSERGVSRNLFGFHDGIIAPHTPAELGRSVWMAPPGAAAPLAGATVMVVRRLRLDVAAFGQLPVDRQEHVIGRRKDTGIPLSGGNQDSPIDLARKEADGTYLVPADSHARMAHPAETGKPLMLRRGYSYVNSPDDMGLIFICYQRDIGSFVQTQYRLDRGDTLMKFATATASGAFVMLPGFSSRRPLGAVSANHD